MDLNSPPDSDLGERRDSDARAKALIAEFEAKRAASKEKPPGKIISWNERDELIRQCVEFGLSPSQILSFSQSWPDPWPFNHLSRVSEKIEVLQLRGVKRRRAKKQIGDHNKAINATFMRIGGQMMERGWMLERIARERKVFDFSPVQPDFYFEAVKGKRREVFCFEVQASSTEFTLWAKKLRRYVHAYEEIKRLGYGDMSLFRVPVMVDKPSELAKAKSDARRVLKKDHDGLNLFLFALTDEVKQKFSDIVSQPIWESVWPDQRAWTLLP